MKAALLTMAAIVSFIFGGIGYRVAMEPDAKTVPVSHEAQRPANPSFICLSMSVARSASSFANVHSSPSSSVPVTRSAPHLFHYRL